MKLGELLRDERIITGEQLESALARQRERGGVLGAILLELGFVDANTLASALARKYGTERVDLERTPPDPKHASRFFVDVPRTEAAALKCCPLELVDPRTLKLAMADPSDVGVLDELRLRTGLAIVPVYAPAPAIQEALRALDTRARSNIAASRRAGRKIDHLTGTDTSTLEVFGRRVTGSESATASAGYLASAIVVDATRRGASDVHIELFDTWHSYVLRVRYRIQGQLEVVFWERSRSSKRSATLYGIGQRLMKMCQGDEQLRARFLAAGEPIEVEYHVSELDVFCGIRWVLRRLWVSGLDTSFVPATESERARALLVASGRGEMETVSALLAAGVDPDGDQSGYTPIMAAARGGHVEVIGALVESGADVLRSDRGHDPLMMAAFCGRADAVRKLIRLGVFDEKSQTMALSLAASEGELDVVRVLIDEGSPDRCPAIFAAATRGRNEVLEALLSDSTMNDVSGGWFGAACTANVEAIGALADRVPDGFDFAELKGRLIEWTILGARLSTVHGSFAQTVAQRLLPEGLRKLGRHDPALRRAIEERYATTARRVGAAAAKHGAALDKGFLTGLLESAIATRNAPLLSALLEAGADPAGAGDTPASPLAYAVQSGSASCVETLLDHGAELTVDALESSGARDHGGLIHLLRSRDRIRWRSSHHSAMVHWAEGEGGAPDFAQLLERSGGGQLERDLENEAIEVVRGRGEILDFSGRGLDRLPSRIFEIDTIAALDLSYNRFEQLPPELANMSKLAALDLSGNRLESLPDALARLGALSELDLSFNRFARFPEVLTRLPGLQALYLDGNRIAIPEEIYGCAVLRKLSLQRCAFRGLPVALRRMSGLEILRLDGNQIGALPPWIGELSSLQVLSLRDTGLRTLPREMGALRCLKVLDVSGNRLTALPEEISELRALQTLYASNNQIRLLPESVASMRLERLDLEHNPLEVTDALRPGLETDSGIQERPPHSPAEPLSGQKPWSSDRPTRPRKRRQSRHRRGR